MLSLLIAELGLLLNRRLDALRTIGMCHRVIDRATRNSALLRNGCGAAGRLLLSLRANRNPKWRTTLRSAALLLRGLTALLWMWLLGIRGGKLITTRRTVEIMLEARSLLLRGALLRRLLLRSLNARITNKALSLRGYLLLPKLWTHGLLLRAWGLLMELRIA